MVTQGKMLPVRRHVTGEPAERVVAEAHARASLDLGTQPKECPEAAT
jgi:hypothetical protein